MKSTSIFFGNHNTPNAIEDYIHFLKGVFSAFPVNISVSKHLYCESDVLVIQEDFNRKLVNNIISFKRHRDDKKLVIVATENIQGGSFNDFHELNKIKHKKQYLMNMAINQVISNSLPSFLYYKYMSRLKRDISGLSNILNRISHDHLGVLAQRYSNFLKVAPFADQIWLMPGLDPAPYLQLFGERVKTFPFILAAPRPRFFEEIQYGALLSGKLSPHRMNLLNYLGLDAPSGNIAEQSWRNTVITSDFAIPLSIRREMLRSTGVYLDLPVSDGSQIFSSMKAAIALEVGIPFFAHTEADPGKFAPFVRTFTDVRSLKEEMGRYSREELAEMGAQFSSDAAKVFTPSAYPFVEELLK
jgi:serine/threonine protein kinase